MRKINLVLKFSPKKSPKRSLQNMFIITGTLLNNWSTFKAKDTYTQSNWYKFSDFMATYVGSEHCSCHHDNECWQPSDKPLLVWCCELIYLISLACLALMGSGKVLIRGIDNLDLTLTVERLYLFPLLAKSPSNLLSCYQGKVTYLRYLWGTVK